MDMTWTRQVEAERKMEDEKQVETDRQRAEVFDALGHPTRILILKVLSEGPIGFADLKKKTGIESGGHLQHHLTKLNGLIKTDEYGKYCLSDQGKDALLTVRTVENATDKKPISQEKSIHRFNFKAGLKPVALLLMALLIASSAAAVYEYNQVGVFQSKLAHSSQISDGYYLPYEGNYSKIFVVSTNSSYGYYPIQTYTYSNGTEVTWGGPCIIISVTIRNDYSTEYPLPNPFPTSNSTSAWVYLMAQLFSGGQQINAMDLSYGPPIPPLFGPYIGSGTALASGESGTITLYLGTNSTNVTSYQIVPTWISGTAPPF